MLPIGANWPAAVPIELISDCSLYAEYQIGKQLVKLVGNCSGLHCLDFHSGHASVAWELSRTASSCAAIGAIKHYIPTCFVDDSTAASGYRQPLFVASPEALAGGFDLILAYDVLDHLNPRYVLGWIRRLLSPTGRCLLRVHPWTSRHAAHQYRIGLNYAFIHLTDLWTTALASQYIMQPLQEYEEQLWHAGFTVIDRQLRYDHIESELQWIVPQACRKLFPKKYHLTESAVAEILEISYIDYWVSRGALHA